MSEEPRPEDRLHLAQWRLVRADGLRLGLVNRAGTLLSANALVMTGVVFASGATSSDVSPAIGAVGLVALVVSACSAALAASVLTGSGKLPALAQPLDSVVPIAFSYGDTVKAFSSPEHFRAGLAAQTVEAAADAAALELWRCISVHQLRARRMRRATQYLLGGAVLLVAMAAAKLITALA
ncbi:hypothetical protein [Streptomyces sp. NRRL S-495]|uniref:hypothetical protein n=1 Tax=Streptomyces sp. NRRL S-495 TaxID=1609133 RepID=UPI0005F8E49B|nr:hypothetical protein [Streptomyces sp. NRRL S-495]KJY25454.1 hypothetical protein VR45_39285 [Streptomyces sp. NRRL S-495]